MVEACIHALQQIDLVVVAHGVLPDQAVCDDDVEAALASFMVNANSAISVTHRFVNVLERQGSGTVVVISSVAGDRGRRSNFVYGAAKAALTAYASGLRAKAAAKGVSVITVKPGLVDTPMTAHLRKTALFASAGHIADAIVRAVASRSSIIYAPWPWRPVMAMVRSVPERWFMKLKA
jgi:decaprenylphospho-beta-D-erythro-pentofuranosid-2-ulose 2-reductase